jgi:hypothetical protein
MKNESEGRTPLWSVWIDCEFLVLKLWRLLHTKEAWSAKFQRYEIWACKRLPCILYSGHTCVLMDTAPANQCHLKWLSSKRSFFGYFGVHLDFLLWQFLFDLKSCFWWFNSIHVFILLVWSFHVLVDSTPPFSSFPWPQTLNFFYHRAHFRPRQPPSLLVFLLCVHKLNPQVTRSVCDPSLLSPM